MQINSVDCLNSRLHGTLNSGHFEDDVVIVINSSLNQILVHM
jgi:hypothetical protein